MSVLPNNRLKHAGQSMMEYSLIAVLITVAAIGGLQLLSGNLKMGIDSLNTAFSDGGGASPGGTDTGSNPGNNPGGSDDTGGNPDISTEPGGSQGTDPGGWGNAPPTETPPVLTPPAEA